MVVKLFACMSVLALFVSIGFAYHASQTELQELSFSLEGLPVYVAAVNGATQNDTKPEFKLDTTVLCMLIKQSVDQSGWSKPGIKIETASLSGRDVLRIIQTAENQESIAELLSKIRKSSPYFVEPEEQSLGIAPKK